MGSFSVDPDLGNYETVASNIEEGDAFTIRKVLAIALTASEGTDPFSLISNSLNEEPCDGVLPLAGEAHFAWRDRLWRVKNRA